LEILPPPFYLSIKQQRNKQLAEDAANTIDFEKTIH